MKERILLAITFLLLTLRLHAQPGAPPDEDRWITVGKGFTGGALHACVEGDHLYVLYNGASWNGPHGTDYRYHIVRLDGGGWTEVNNFFCDGQISAFTSFQGRFHIGGSFSTMFDTVKAEGIARLNGARWEALAVGDSTEVMTMIEFRGELYVAQRIYRYATEPVAAVVRWDGSRWERIGRPQDTFPPGQWIFDLEVYRGELHAGGTFTAIGDQRIGHIARWDGSAWHPLGEGVDAGVGRMATYRDELYVSGQDIRKAGGTAVRNVARWNGSDWAGVGDHESWPSPANFAIHNGELYATPTFADNGVSHWDGARWAQAGAFDQSANFLIEYHGSLYAGGWFFKDQNHIAILCEAGNCGVIEGDLYYDRNGDCHKDEADTGAGSAFMEVTPGPFYAPVDENGHYFFFVPYGTYTVRLHPHLHWDQICPAPGASYSPTLSADAGTSSHNDFGSRPQPGAEDLRVSIAGGHARPGEPSHYVIRYTNVGTIAMNGTVRLTLDPNITFVSSDPAPSRVNGTIVEWDFANLKTDEMRQITVRTSVSIWAPLGEILCGIVEIGAIAGGLEQPNDLIPSDNVDSWCVRVSNSYDPNDLAVTPMGVEDDGEITRADSILTYAIRFQNTGNDTAFKVVVIDTLSPLLDPMSIHLGASSHPYTFSLHGSGILVWTFDNILLPDSGANEQKSHGFFKYTVQQRPDLPSGARITNRVGIYFDHNAPVMTNTVVSIIDQPSSVPMADAGSAITLYPNPTNGKLLVRGEMLGGGIASLSDVLGRTVMTATASGAELALDLTGLPPGVYFLTLPTRMGMATRQVFVAH